LCHGVVRFVLPRDRRAVFTFAPLQGKTFAASIAADERAALPDSIMVRTSAGALLTRSDAAIYILKQLGGLWRAAAAALRLVPRGGRAGPYDVFPRRRYGWFGRETDVCPLVPEALRSRFER